MKSVDRALAERAARQHQVFSREQARAAGMSSSALSRRTTSGLIVPCGVHSLHFAGATLSYRGWLQAGLFDAGSHAVVSGAAAAHLHGLDGFGDARPEFLTLRSDRGRRSSVSVHTIGEFQRLDRTVVDGLPCASPTLTVVRLFASGRYDAAVDALDSACRMRLTAIPVVRDRFGRMGAGARAGIADFERAVREAAVDSWLERRFLALLRSAGLPLPECQQRHELDGVGVVRVDFEYRGRPIVIEVGGRLGYLSSSDRRKKERRRNALQGDGKTVYFFCRADVVGDPRYVTATVAKALVAGSDRPGSCNLC